MRQRGRDPPQAERLPAEIDSTVDSVFWGQLTCEAPQPHGPIATAGGKVIDVRIGGNGTYAVSVTWPRMAFNVGIIASFYNAVEYTPQESNL